MGWIGIAAPAKTPVPILDNLNAEMRRILGEPDVKERLLRTYWTIPDRQIETSVVLADRRWLERNPLSPKGEDQDGAGEGSQP